MLRSFALRRLTVSLALLVVLAFAAACGGGQPAPASTGAAPATQAPATQASATQAPANTAAPQPTAATEPAAPQPTAAPTQTPKPTSAPPPSPTAAPAAPSGQGAMDFFLQVAEAQAGQPTMRMTMTSVKAGQTTETIMELVRPDRLRSTGGPGGDLVIVPEGTYMKAAGGQWQKAPFDMSDAIGEMLSQASVEEMLKQMPVEKLRAGGADVVNGKACWVYEYEQMLEVAGQTIKSQAKIWVGIADKLPYKSVAETESSAEPGVITTTTILYEYGADLQIEAPVP